MEISQVMYGLLLATFAGLSTTLGALAVFFVKQESRFLSLSMGFSAGVMIGISILKLLPQSIKNLDSFGLDGLMIAGFSFILGMVVVALLDFFIPHEYIHEHSREDIEQTNGRLARLGRTGQLVAIGIAIHNLPEGFVTMTGSLHSMELGLLLAIAIALHNIPEGLSVAIPIYASSNDKKKAFKLSFLSGITEPLGALLSVIVLITFGFTTSEFIEATLAFVAGIMVFISLDELLPSARANCVESGNTSHNVTFGIISGITVMFFTLIILG